MAAAIGASATGVRTFTATNSQGLLLMSEMCFIASGMRLPIVMGIANRAVSAPINIWCFTKEAKVLMADLTYRSIYKIKKGDMILGKDKKGNLRFTEVKRVFKRETDKLVKLKTDKFDVICTPDHRFYERNGHDHWMKASNLYSKKLHWFGYGYEINSEFKRGWLAGMADGDGAFYSQKNTYRFRLKLKDEEIIDTFVKWTNQFDYPLRKVDYLEKEGYFIAILTSTPKSRMFKHFLKKTKNFDFYRGYIAGMYDAEGSGPFKVKQAVIYNSDPSIIKIISKYLRTLGLNFKVYTDKRRGINHIRDNYHIKINNVPEFFIKCRPVLERKRKNILKMTLKSVKTCLKINDVISINKKIKVYNLETGTNNYIINGFLVHNCDHSDTMALRDSGWIQFYVESAQEAYDTTIQAYKVAEKLFLPAMVCIDGFNLSHLWEPVDLLAQKDVDSFLPKYKPMFKLDPQKPVTMGPVAFPDSYMDFKKQQQEAMESAIKEVIKVSTEFKKRFKRSYGNGLIETYNLKGAKTAYVCMGSVCTTIRGVIDSLKKEGKKVGLIKIKCFRPFPTKEILKSIKYIKTLIIMDRAVSLGNEGILYNELKAALRKQKTDIKGYVIGLGGRSIAHYSLRKALKNANKKGVEWL